MRKFTCSRAAGSLPALAALSFLILPLTGCGGSSSGGSSSPATGIQGELVQTKEGGPPGAPVVTAALVGGLVTVLSADGSKAVATATTGSAGYFQISLPPGTYQVEASQFANNVPQTVTVTATGYLPVSVIGYLMAP